ANRAVDGVGSFIHVPKCLAVGVGRGHEEAAGELAVQLCLKRIVVRARAQELESNVPSQPVEGKERPVLVRGNGARKRGCVQIIDGWQIYAVVAYVGRF